MGSVCQSEEKQKKAAGLGFDLMTSGLRARLAVLAIWAAVLW